MKFGGACLSGAGNVKKAVQLVAREVLSGKRVVVVVSAMGGTTDELLKLTLEVTNGNPEPYHLAEILSMGERTSARVFTAALRSAGVDAIYLDPSSELWPIITSENPYDAEPLVEETRKAVKRVVGGLLAKGKTLVVCGFLGKSKSGKVTTLGRGGSDTTAILIASCLGARKVYIVKEVDGLFTADPKLVKNAKPLPELSSMEVKEAAFYGLKALHHKSLNYVNPDMEVLVVGLNGGLLTSGTRVYGGSFVKVEKVARNAGLITLTGVNNFAEVLEKVSRLSNLLADVTVRGTSLSLLVDKKHLNELVRKLHDNIVLRGFAKLISVIEGVSLLVVSGVGVENHEFLLRLVRLLQENNVKPLDLHVSGSGIKFILHENQFGKLMKILRKLGVVLVG